MTTANAYKVFKNSLLFISCLVFIFIAFGAEAMTYPITWTPSSIDQTIKVGGTKDLTVSFKSSTSLKNVDLLIDPALQPFATITPSHFNTINKYTSYNVKVHLSIPAGTQSGIYTGAINLSVGTKTYPQPLKIKISVPEEPKPPITWSPGSIEQTIGLGGTKDLTVSFKSNTRLKNIDLWVVPKLQPFVTVTPKHFATINANTSYSVNVHISVPLGSHTGQYSGTVQIKVCSTTYAQPLKVVLNIVDASATIGPAGGVVEVADPSSSIYGTRISIPEDALAEETIVVMQPAPYAEIMSTIPSASQFLGGIELKPDGLQFSSPIMLTIPISESYPQGTLLPFILYDTVEGGHYFETYGVVATSGNAVEAEISHFSAHWVSSFFDTNDPCVKELEDQSASHFAFPFLENYWWAETYSKHGPECLPNDTKSCAVDLYLAEPNKQFPDSFDDTRTLSKDKIINAMHNGRAFIFLYEITDNGLTGDSDSFEYEKRCSNASTMSCVKNSDCSQGGSCELKILRNIPIHAFKIVDKDGKERAIDIELLIKDTDYNLLTLYAHLDISPNILKDVTSLIENAIRYLYNITYVYNSPARVAIDTGHDVQRGDPTGIGVVGKYGHATYPHLHLNIFSNEYFSVNNPRLGTSCRFRNGGVLVGGEALLDPLRNWPGTDIYSTIPRNHFTAGDLVVVDNPLRPDSSATVLNSKATGGPDPNNPMGNAPKDTLGNILSPTPKVEQYPLNSGNYFVWWNVEYPTLNIGDGWTVSFALQKTVAPSPIRFPDTGQTTCYEGAGNVITCPVPGQSGAQDGSYSINPMSYTDNSNGTVTDNNTGLIWQKEDDGTALTWDQAISYCASLSLPGTGWRLPSKKELISIVDYGIEYPGPTINPIFTKAKQSDYWTFTPSAYYPGDAWAVGFIYGHVGGNGKDGDFYVRCVRGEQQSSSFTDNGNSTVTDNKTGLMWQQGEGGYMTRDSAISNCEGLSLGGYSDWRLPNIKELESITDDTIYDPINPVAIDRNLFPNAVASYYWSSSTYVHNPAYPWSVDFNGGYVDLYGSYSSLSYVRCVRGGQIVVPYFYENRTLNTPFCKRG